MGRPPLSRWGCHPVGAESHTAARKGEMTGSVGFSAHSWPHLGTLAESPPCTPVRPCISSPLPKTLSDNWIYMK